MVCSFWNFSFKAWAWITYRLDRMRWWREVVPYLHISCDFPGREFVVSELVCVEGLCSFWSSCVLNDNHSNLVSFPERSHFLWVSGLLSRFFWWACGKIVFLRRIELRGLKLWWSGTSVLIRFWRLWLCNLFLFLDLKNECFGFHQCLTASQTFSNLKVYLHARLSRKEDDACWTCHGCKVYGSCRQYSWTPALRLVVVAGPGSDEILEFQFVRFVAAGLAGLVTGEILEL